MKTIYRAENVFDASLVRDLLDQAGILAFVQGAVLQGGIGELPASGLVTVMVADEDVVSARRIVEEFEAAHRVDDSASASELQLPGTLLDPGT